MKNSILIKIAQKFIPKGPLNNTSGNGAEQATSVSWTNADSAHWRLYATVPHNKLSSTNNPIIRNGWQNIFVHDQCPLSLTWFNFNPSMDK